MSTIRRVPNALVSGVVRETPTACTPTPEQAGDPTSTLTSAVQLSTSSRAAPRWDPSRERPGHEAKPGDVPGQGVVEQSSCSDAQIRFS
jgi:hypothetical protein